MSKLSATPPPIDNDLGEDMEEEVEEIDKFDARRRNNKLTADKPSWPSSCWRWSTFYDRTTRHSPTGANPSTTEMHVSGCTTTDTQEIH
jgi:hypothetical protein